jgi:hypothetical protein
MPQVEVYMGGDPNPAFVQEDKNLNYPAALELKRVGDDGTILDTLTISPTGIVVNGAPIGGGGASQRWYTGSRVPSNSLGNDGDFYLRSSTGDLYQKASGSWT